MEIFMSVKAISLRVDKNKIDELDKLAEDLKRDRSFVINEAIETYLDIHKWQTEHIKNAIKQADANEFATEKDLQKVFKKWQA